MESARTSASQVRSVEERAARFLTQNGPSPCSPDSVRVDPELSFRWGRAAGAALLNKLPLFMPYDLYGYLTIVHTNGRQDRMSKRPLTSSRDIPVRGQRGLQPR
jgi:hypothetical protein